VLQILYGRVARLYSVSSAKSLPMDPLPLLTSSTSACSWFNVRTAFFIKRWIVDELADGAFAAIERVDNGVDFRQDGIELFDGALAGLITSLRLGVSVVGSSAFSVTCGAGGGFAVDVDDRVAEYTDSFKAGLGVGMKGGHEPLLIFMMTSTGVSLRSGTMWMDFTLPMATPSRFTGAPTLRPADSQSRNEW